MADKSDSPIINTAPKYDGLMGAMPVFNGA